MKFKFLSIAIALIAFSSCQKEETTAPYSIFKNSNYASINQTVVEVDLNSQYDLIIDSGFESTNPTYSLQKNNGAQQVISDSSFVTMESHGWNGVLGLRTEVVRVQLNFDSNQFNVGDQLKICANQNSMGRSQLFKVK